MLSDLPLTSWQPDLGVSREHASLWVPDSPDSAWVRDLGTTNGTYVNGHRLEANEWTPLHVRDVISFGTKDVEYRLEDWELRSRALRGGDGSGECGICLERFVYPHELECGHVFCLDCIERWTVQSAGRTCPLCRRVILKAPRCQASSLRTCCSAGRGSWAGDEPGCVQTVNSRIRSRSI